MAFSSALRAPRRDSMLSCTFTKRATWSSVSSPLSGGVNEALFVTVLSISASSPSCLKLVMYALAGLHTNT